MLELSNAFKSLKKKKELIIRPEEARQFQIKINHHLMHDVRHFHLEHGIRLKMKKRKTVG